MEFLYFLGRFHPLLLHLPIGILVLAFAMELASRRPRFAALAPAMPFVLALGAASAVLTALLGYLLSLEGGYTGDSLTVHQYAGFGLAALATLLVFLHRSPALQRFYLPGFSLLMVLLLVTGHYGGNLTHGSNYLTEYAPNPLRQAMGLPAKIDFSAIDLATLDSMPAYAAITQPILDDKCVSCHNPDKTKGELRLDGREGILRGGETGPVLEPGQPEASLLVERIHLPEIDEQHMPPEGKEQLSEDEKALLAWWIEQGADFEKPVGQYDKPEDIEEALRRRFEPQGPEGVFALDIDPLSASRLSDLHEAGLPLRPLALESPLLELNLANRQDISAEQIGRLQAASDQVVKINLSNTPTDDDILAELGQLPHLIHLHLDRTDITDEGLQALEGMEYLEYLNLFQTGITDRGLKVLAGLPSLRNVYLWQTQTTEAGVEQLRQALPKTYIDTGTDLGEAMRTGPLSAPLIEAENVFFLDEARVALSSASDAAIYYTLDGSEPDSSSTRYREPLQLDADATLKAIAYAPERPPSPIAQEAFVRLNYEPLDISLEPAADPQYPGRGAQVLHDLERGSKAFRENKDPWMGWEATNPTITIDLGQPRQVRRVLISSLEDSDAWIFFPRGARVSLSTDGNQYREVAKGAFPTLSEPAPPRTDLFTLRFPAGSARYVRVEVLGRTTNPRWHPNAGEPCWLFLDEILVD